AWVHATERGSELTIMAPITHQLLSNMIPTLGDVDLLPFTAQSDERRLPASQSALDFEVRFPYPVDIPYWESPQKSYHAILVVDTRVFAVLGTVFGQKSQWAEGTFAVFALVTVLFLLVELASLIAGVRL